MDRIILIQILETVVKHLKASECPNINIIEKSYGHTITEEGNKVPDQRFKEIDVRGIYLDNKLYKDKRDYLIIDTGNETNRI